MAHQIGRWSIKHFPYPGQEVLVIFSNAAMHNQIHELDVRPPRPPQPIFRGAIGVTAASFLPVNRKEKRVCCGRPIPAGVGEKGPGLFKDLPRPERRLLLTAQWASRCLTGSCQRS